MFIDDKWQQIPEFSMESIVKYIHQFACKVSYKIYLEDDLCQLVMQLFWHVRLSVLCEINWYGATI